MEYESSVKNILSSSLDQIRTIIDANTVVGNPIHTPSGTVIIPISKVSMGFASGGLDYNGKTANTKQNFGGGGGTGVSVTPVGFLTVSADGKVELITIANPGGDSVDKIASLVERTPDILEKIKAVFQKKKTEEEAPESTEDAGE